MTTPSTEPRAARGADAVTRAIYAFPRNLVLAASAGTGKTHALVGVAIHLLMGACRNVEGGLRDPLAPEALVATTFSRKAAGEIRTRLREELEKLASGDLRAAYREDLVAAFALTGGTSDAELAVRAGRVLGRLGRAKIGTLHSFAASIVRTNAVALGLSPDFDLPDEETTRERTVLAIERVLEPRADRAQVRSLLQLAGGGGAFVDLLRGLLNRVADDGGAAADLALAEGDAAHIDASLRTFVAHACDLTAEPKLGKAATQVVAAFDRRDVEALEQAAADLCSITKAGKRSPAADAFFDYRDELPKATSNPERGRALVRRWNVRDLILPRAQALKEILVACEVEVAEANARDSVLGFADVLRAARDVLRDHPSLAAETSAALGALLVDEFQDTSGVQRDLVQLLWERDGRDGELRAPGVVPRAADLRGGGLLVVGDRKQSIYGFRGADAAVFAELCVGLAGAPAREALAIPHGAVWEPEEPNADFLALRHNRRGEPELLEFANACSRLMLVPESPPAEPYEVDYVAATEDLLSPAAPRATPPSPRTHWLRLAVPPGKRSTPRLAEAEVIAARIGSIVRGSEVSVRGVPARWRDIAVLAPGHEMLAAVAYTLAQDGIPHVVAGMGFYGTREVRDVVAMLACLADPDDSLALAEVLRGPWVGATDRTLVGLTDRHAGLADLARWGSGERRDLILAVDRPALDALANVLTTLRPVLGRIGPGEALREAVRALQLEETLALLPRGEQRVANVRKVLSMADRAADPIVLLRRLRRAATDEQKEGEAAMFSDEDDAVRLLTVHASKGLAFPIVFLPEAGAVPGSHGFASMVIERGALGSPSTLALKTVDDLGSAHDTESYARAKRDLARREAAERRRLRYVAITRASEAMFFVGDRAVPKSGRDTYERSTAAVLARLSDDDGERRAAQMTVETGESLRRRATTET